MPPPPGIGAPVAWGDADRLRELFGGRVRSMRINDRTWIWRHRSAGDFADTYRAWFGPVNRTFAALAAAAAEYAAGLAEIARNANRATDGTIAAAFAYVTVVIDR